MDTLTPVDVFDGFIRKIQDRLDQVKTRHRRNCEDLAPSLKRQCDINPLLMRDISADEAVERCLSDLLNMGQARVLHLRARENETKAKS